MNVLRRIRLFQLSGLSMAVFSGAAFAQTASRPTGVSVGLPPPESALWKLMNAYAGGRKIEQTLITLDMSELVETGSSVPARAKVDSPMTATDYVQSLVLFNELNPINEIIEARFTSSNPVAEIETRIKLANSQWVMAMAKTSDGRCLAQGRQVVVTLGSCVG
jgi:sulfur-oxidizing protein SoxY